MQIDTNEAKLYNAHTRDKISCVQPLNIFLKAICRYFLISKTIQMGNKERTSYGINKERTRYRIPQITNITSLVPPFCELSHEWVWRKANPQGWLILPKASVSFPVCRMLLLLHSTTKKGSWTEKSVLFCLTY